MIESFKHKGLERYFTDGGKRGIPAQSAKRIERMLDRFDGQHATAVNLEDYH